MTTLPIPNAAAASGSIAQRLEKIRVAYAEDPRQMTAVLARQHGVPEVEVIGVLPKGQATELDVSRWESIIRALEPAGEVRVVQSNASGVLEVVGRFGGFSQTGPYFNVLTKTLDMHLLPHTFARVFAVEKPGHTGKGSTLSVQFYNTHGDAAFKVFLAFGRGEVSEETRVLWERIRDGHRLG